MGTTAPHSQAFPTGLSAGTQGATWQDSARGQAKEAGQGPRTRVFPASFTLDSLALSVLPGLSSGAEANQTDWMGRA